MSIVIYFHIGYKKTGSSAIQSFLNYNRNRLFKEQHLLYPNFYSFDLSEGFCHNHSGLFQDVSKSNFLTCLQQFKDCIDFCNNSGVSTIVISAEYAEWDFWPELIRKISEEFEVDYRVILYLRRQDSYVEAAWKQWGHKDRNHNSIMEYYDSLDLDWNKLVLFWTNSIDIKKLIVRPYDKHSINKDVITDFFKILGIETNKDLNFPPDNNINVNRGFNNDIIELMILCTSLTPEIHEHELMDFLYGCLSEKYKKQPFDSYNLLNPTDRYDIIKRFEQSNNSLAELLWGKGATLFNDPIPDKNEVWVQNTGLTFEKTVPIFMELLISQSKGIDFLKQQNKILPTLMEGLEMQSKEMLILKNQLKDLQNSVFHNLLFCSFPKEIFQKSKFNQHISVTRKTETFLEIIITGEDPQIILPAYRLSKRPMRLIIEITSSIAGKAQIYYLTSRCKYYSEANSIIHPFPEGTNSISFIIHEHDLRGRLRLDFEQNEDAIQIHSICGKN
jgi:hypothetical protein